MSMMGMLPRTASMVGSNAAVVSFGMHPFGFDSTTLPCPMGHLVFGAILWAVAVRIIAKRP